MSRSRSSIRNRSGSSALAVAIAVASSRTARAKKAAMLEKLQNSPRKLRPEQGWQGPGRFILYIREGP